MEKLAAPQELEALLAEVPYLRSLASSLLEGEEDDLVQQTYLQAMQEKRASRVESPLSWLRWILRNLASNTRWGRDSSRVRGRAHITTDS